MRAIRIAALVMVAGLTWMLMRREAFAHSAPAVAVQVAAVVLMVAARVTFAVKISSSPFARCLVFHRRHSDDPMQVFKVAEEVQFFLECGCTGLCVLLG